MNTLQAPKLYHVHTHLSLLSLFPPTSPPTSPSLSSLSLSLAEARPSASRQARSRAHTPKGLRKLYIGQIDTGRLEMPGIFHKHAKYTLGYTLRLLENQRWVFSFSEKHFHHGQIDPGRKVIPGIFHKHAKYTQHTYGLIKSRLGFPYSEKKIHHGQIGLGRTAMPWIFYTASQVHTPMVLENQLWVFL